MRAEWLFSLALIRAQTNDHDSITGIVGRPVSDGATINLGRRGWLDFKIGIALIESTFPPLRWPIRKSKESP